MSEEAPARPKGRPKGTMTSFASAHQARERGQAHRLAAADFLYGLSPDESSNMMRIGDATAARLRETKWYKIRYAYLEAKIEAVDDEIAKESKRLRMALGELVPRSIEVLKEHLWANQRTDQFKAAQEVLALPMFPELTEAEIRHVVSSIADFYS